MTDARCRSAEDNTFSFSRRIATVEEAMAAATGLNEEIGAFLAARGVPKDRVSVVHIAVDEILTNIGKYGAAPDKAVLVHGCVEHGDGLIRLRLADDGAPFDPGSAAPPDTELALDERVVGGLGIHMLFSLFDGFSYQRRKNENVSEWTMRILP